MGQRSRSPLNDFDRDIGYTLLVGGLALALLTIIFVAVNARVGDDCAAQGGHLVTGPGSTVVGTSSNGGMVIGYATGPTTCEPNR